MEPIKSIRQTNGILFINEKRSNINPAKVIIRVNGVQHENWAYADRTQAHLVRETTDTTGKKTQATYPDGKPRTYVAAGTTEIIVPDYV